MSVVTTVQNFINYSKFVGDFFILSLQELLKYILPPSFNGFIVHFIVLWLFEKLYRPITVISMITVNNIQIYNCDVFTVFCKYCKRYKTIYGLIGLIYANILYNIDAPLQKHNSVIFRSLFTSLDFSNMW